MRANLNSALSDHAYFAGKSIGYAYEFRFVPDLRDLFLARFSWEWSHVKSDPKGFRQADAYVSWNAREAGITLKSIRSKLVEERLCSSCEFNAFCYHRYGLFGQDVVDLFAQAVLNPGVLVDLQGWPAMLLVHDFA
jgi:hypothetical protein